MAKYHHPARSLPGCVSDSADDTLPHISTLPHVARLQSAIYNNTRLVSLIGKVPVCCVGGRGSIPGWTLTQGLKIIEEKVLPLL